MELRGQSVPAASTAPAGCVPGPRTASGARLWLRDPRTLQLVFVVAVLLPGQVDCPSPRQDQVPQLTVAPQQQRHSLKEEECPAGSHRSEYTGSCIGCTEGVDYTNVSNNLPSCLPCTICKSDEEELSPCATTRDTECRCKPGTFRNDNSTEMCRKCHTRCPRGMVKVRDCTCWSDIKCVDESAASSTGKPPAAEETVTSSPGTPASVFYILQIVIGVISFVSVVAFVYILFWKKLTSFPKLICSGGGGDSESVHRVFFWRLCPSRGPGAKDSAYNETLSNRDSQPAHVPEQEIEGQELRESAGVTMQSPEEPQHLLGQAEAEGCQRRSLQVPVNDADPTEINVLLDALVTPEEGRAKEIIQD
ncbi:tumor necrosis factor receptor superfamily member 10D [Saimiri boliviensis]|uniref:tumor necrosis factor receptor superfamily member 10D n=1 Tax=Saimiri boliviensis TaxID=27679 RepID=UPI003D785E2A